MLDRGQMLVTSAAQTIGCIRCCARAHPRSEVCKGCDPASNRYHTIWSEFDGLRSLPRLRLSTLGEGKGARRGKITSHAMPDCS